MTHNSETQIVDLFRASRWSSRSVFFGLVILFLLTASQFFTSNEMVSSIPAWVLLILGIVVFEGTLLTFPLLTRQPPSSGIYKRPKVTKILKEAAIAVPLTIGCIIFIACLQLLINLMLPNASLSPEVFERMSKSPADFNTYGFLLTAFLIAPFVEEIFFRGFLFNAFRQRMPLVLAILLQSLIFGLAHYYGRGLAHSLVISVIGLILTLIYMWRKTILAPIFVHTGFNFMFAVAMLVSIQTFPDSAILGIYPERGSKECVIAQVFPNSPADRVGLQPGDKIVRFQEWEIKTFQNLLNSLEWYEAGDTVSIVVQREGTEIEFDVVLASRKSMQERRKNKSDNLKE